ncbi:MAG: amino acid ABC transporter ATP-binding protein [Bacillota bacterium]
MKLIDAKNVNKSFGDNHVLKDISLTVEKGEVVAIIGPSGCGKSTFLRILTQLETADTGEIEICGNTLLDSSQNPPITADKETAHKIQLATGLVFQNFCLFPHMSVINNIIHPQVKVLGTAPEVARANAEDLLEKMNLSDKADAYPNELSGGQQQRIAIARALGLSPDVLFFDEPTSALDPELTGEILKVIKDLAKEKITMAIVTHEMAFAKGVADKVVFMDEGHVVEYGTPEEVFVNSKVQRVRDFLRRYDQESWAE